MKIAYIDLGVNRPRESYALNPKRYGGGACFARYAKIELNTSNDLFDIHAPIESFNELGEDEGRSGCFGLTEAEMSAMRNGENIRGYIKDAEKYDIFVYHHDCLAINASGLSGKLVSWSLMGDNGAQHPSTPYVLLYRPGEQARYGKGFPVTIGKFVPSCFTYPSLKTESLFQCSRHDVHMNTIEVAKFCLANKNISGIFAGPILDNYPLIDYINNKDTVYLGLISEIDKLDYCKQAIATTYLHTWDTAFNLSAIESLSVGTPIIAAKRGCFEYIIEEGVNGYFWQSGDDLSALVEKCKRLDPLKVWETAHRFSHKAMVRSFHKAFQEILSL